MVLPHHPKFKPKTWDKIRVAFNATAKNKGKSVYLPWCTGPKFLSECIGCTCKIIILQ